MEATTKKQHYIWRKYLSPWTENNSNTGKIACLRNQKVFSTSLMNVAHENYFYEITEMSPREKNLVYSLAIEHGANRQKEVNQGWLEFCCAPYDFANWIQNCGKSINGQHYDIYKDKNFTALLIEHIERLHCQIEISGIKYIDLIKNGDLSFWNDDKSRDEFSFFLSMQIFRTKCMRDKIVGCIDQCLKTCRGLEDIRPHNIWLPLSLIFASNIGAHITHDYFPVLLCNKEDFFVVGDQPIINTFAIPYSEREPDDMELFYPITTHTAILITQGKQYVSGQIKEIDNSMMEKYNLMEMRNSEEITFAKSEDQLKSLALKL